MNQRALLAGAAAAALAAGLYALTLMTVVSGCSSVYCVEVGEYQVALALWGTVHQTGYPLYLLLGSPFVASLRWLSVPPAAGASLFSLVWAAAAVFGAAVLAARLTHSAALGFAAGFLLAVFEPVWVHGSLAQVHSLSLAFAVALLAVGVRLRQTWTHRAAWLWVFLAGLGVAHSRWLFIVVAVVGLWLLPAARRPAARGAWLAVAGACFAAGFLPYLYLPLRAWMGATWHYGEPGTWTGFWTLFAGGEARAQPAPLAPAASMWEAALQLAWLVRDALTWPGVAAAVIAAAVALWRRPWGHPAILLAGAAVAYLTLLVVIPGVVLAEARLMIVLLSVALLAALSVARLRPPWRHAGLAGMLLWAGYLAQGNYPRVAYLTRATATVDFVRYAEQIEAAPGAVLMAPWGSHYFGLAYARYVEGRLVGRLVVDDSADFAALAGAGATLYTSQETLYIYGTEWWGYRMGTPLRVSSAGPQLVALTTRPVGADASLASSLPAGVRLGGGIALAGWQVQMLDAQTLWITLHWNATRTPSRAFGTFAYVIRRPHSLAFDNLVAQSDWDVPVYGFYPTTQWQPGETVREDHLIDLPPGQTARRVAVGMAYPNDDGNLEYLGPVFVSQQADGTWALDE